MSTLYANRAVRSRLMEFLGGDTLAHATAVYISRTDGYDFDPEMAMPASELGRLLAEEGDIARSLADSASFLFHLDMEYVNFDSPAEAYLDPWRTFDLQEPVVRVVETLLLEWGIRPLHLITGQGHHFVWRIAHDGELAGRLARLCPAPELLEACEERVPAQMTGAINREAQAVFSTISLLMEYVAHRIKAAAEPLVSFPVEITAVHVGPVASSQREIISVDVSEYGDPLFTRRIRMPFTHYLKPWVTGLARRLGVEDEIPACYAIPLHEMDIRQAIKVRQVEEDVIDLAGRACVRIPEQSEGTAHLWQEYLSSPLRRFHEYFYSAMHDSKECWSETYDRTPVEALPPCARHIVTWPNDLLLKPAGIQLVTRCLLADGWHPRHIAGFIRSKYENPEFKWGVNWNAYVPALRADFYTRLFAGLHATGLDSLVDLNCTSNREKGFCFPPEQAGCELESTRRKLLAHCTP